VSPSLLQTNGSPHPSCDLPSLIAFSFNQHCLQPWAYQLFILHALLVLSSPRWRLTGWRWLMISIYVYSMSKMDYSFAQHGLLPGRFLHACGLADGTAHWLAKVWFPAVMPARNCSRRCVFALHAAVGDYFR
jgi:hypothetical protein